MAEHINKTDTLNEGRVKLNVAISDAESAKVTAEGADVKSTQALANSESTQTQLDTIVIDGDSSVEAAQARVDEKGESHSTLKDRIDDGFTKTNAQLAETEQEVDGIFREIDENMLAMDLQAIDTENLEARGEYLPVIEKNSGVEVITLADRIELRGNVTETLNVYYRDINKYRDYDFLISNRLDTVFYIALQLNGGTVSVVMEDGSVELMHTSSGNVRYLVPEGARNLRLSTLPLEKDGVAVSDKWDYKYLYPRTNLALLVAVTGATSGSISVDMIGRY